MTQVRFTSCPVAFASPPPTPFFAIPEIGTFVPTGSPLVPLLPTRNKHLTSPLSPHHPPRQPNHAVNETIALSLPVTFHVADDVVGRRGVLHVTTRRLVWFGDDGAGFEVPFQALTMHAVSTDTSEGFKPCIYAQVEGLVPEGFGENDDDENEDDDEDGDDEFGDTTELRLAPTDSSKLNDLFKTLCECAAMNPDSEDEEVACPISINPTVAGSSIILKAAPTCRLWPSGPHRFHPTAAWQPLYITTIYSAP